jgi:serine/threonine-protein kinase
MSPEQMRSSKNVDQRTDIYALGVCLYELLSGTQPFVAETFSELCVKVNVEDPTPLRDHRSDVSEELAGVIARAYARGLDDRYQTIVEMVSALAPFAGDRTLPLIRKICGGTIPEPPAPLQATVTAMTTDKGAPRVQTSVVLALFAIAAVAAVAIFSLKPTAREADPNALASPPEEGVPAATTASVITPPASAAKAGVEASATASAAASPSASASSSASAAKPQFVRPRRPPRRPPPRRPPKPCFKDDPVTGLKVPC